MENLFNSHIDELKDKNSETKKHWDNIKSSFTNAPISLVNFDSNMRIKSANNHFIKLIEKQHDEIAEVPFGEYIRCENSIVNGCGNNALCAECTIRNTLNEVIRTGNPISDVDVAVRTFNGSASYITSEDKYFRISIIPNDFDEEIEGTMILVDVTDQKLIEKNIRKKGDLFYAMFNSFPYLISQSKDGLNRNFLNSSWVNFTGDDIHHATGGDFLEIIHPEDRKKAALELNEAYVNRQETKSVYRVRRWDGEYRNIEEHMCPLELNGNFSGIIGLGRDITEDASLRESERKYFLLVENAGDMLFLTDEHGIIIECNKAVELNYGYKKEEIINEGLFHICMKDNSQENKIDIYRLMETSEYEITHFKKDGTSFPAEVSSRNFIIDDKSYYVNVVRDITERKKTEAKLAENEEQYRLLFMNLDMAFSRIAVIKDENSIPIELKITDINDEFEQFMEDKRSNIIGKSGKEFLPYIFGDRICLNDVINKVAIRHEVIKLEDFQTPYSSNRWYDASFYSNGKDCLSLMIHDRTVTRIAEIEMRRAIEVANDSYRAKSEFLANMSHEIRTPLNGILGMLDLTLLDKGLTVDQVDNLTTAKNCADSLLRIINDILDFSKMEVGKYKLDNIEFDIIKLIKKTIKVHQHKADQKNVKLNMTIAKDVPQNIIGDPDRLLQVFNNLIGNALKFTEKGSVELIVELVKYIDNKIVLMFTVKDTGIGIEAIDQEKLFKSFSQVDGSHTRKYGGTGLGLVISKQLVELMNGEIWVESVKGQGSSFKFTIVPEVVLDKKSIKAEAVEQKLVTTKKVHIILAEDDRVNRIVTGRMLGELGYTYDIASNGQEAYSLICKNTYDLCLMDIQMPEMDGLQTTALVRLDEKETGKHLPIVALTAFALFGDKEKFLASGIDEYLAKPFQMSDLASIIEVALEKSGFNDKNDYEKILDDITNDRSISIDRTKKDIEENMRKLRIEIETLQKVINDKNFSLIDEICGCIKERSSYLDFESIKVNAFRIQLLARRNNPEGISQIYNDMKQNFQDLCMSSVF